jgi:hypothetical protein
MRSESAELAHEVDLHPVTQVIRQFVEVAPVGLGQDQLGDAGPLGCHHLFADAADWQHLSGEGQFTGHRQRPVDVPPRGERDQRGGQGDAGTRAILGGGAFGHMQVDVAAAEELRIDAELHRLCVDVAVGDVGRLLHHLAELAGQLEAAPLGMDPAGLDRQGGATQGGPGQPGHHTHLPDRLVGTEQRTAQMALDILDADVEALAG